MKRTSPLVIWSIEISMILGNNMIQESRLSILCSNMNCLWQTNCKYSNNKHLDMGIYWLNAYLKLLCTPLHHETIQNCKRKSVILQPLRLQIHLLIERKRTKTWSFPSSERINEFESNNYPVPIYIRGLNSCSILQEHICHSNPTPHCRPMQRCLLHVISCIDIAAMLR